MRELLFRGKRVDNGEWVEGFYVHLLPGKGRNSYRIYAGYAETDFGDFYPDWYEIDPATAGQYTGLTANGKRIFEGDIVKLIDSRFRYSYAGVVCFYEGSFCIKLKGFREEIFHRIGEKEKWQEMGASGTLTYQYEILGNAYDHRELLEEVQLCRSLT